MLLRVALVLTGMALVVPPASAADIDVTFIDRFPSHDYHESPGWPQAGQTVSFVAHMKLAGAESEVASYIWFLDGVELA